MDWSFLRVFSSKTWLRLGVVFAGFVLLVTLFVELADEVREQGTVRFDTAFLEYVNTFSSPLLDTFFIITTHLGGVFTVIAITLSLSVLLWRHHLRRKALFLSVGVGGAALLNLLLKAVFERQRPELWERLVLEQSYSFPSGHAMASSALALCLVVIFWPTRWRWVVIGSAAVYVLVVGFSRLYLGVHYPTDIVAGWLVSATWVIITWLVLGFKKK